MAKIIGKQYRFHLISLFDVTSDALGFQGISKNIRQNKKDEMIVLENDCEVKAWISITHN